ncbi:MAG: methyltransferase domain-containing protein [Proteobacteria bacterium]|nr:methyltransferase domain-containing protein [Pseudomonadota bacterium]
MERVQRIRPSLVCPRCHGSLEDRDEGLLCPACAHTFRTVDGVPHLRVSDAGAQAGYHRGFRGRLRRSPAVYRWIFRLLAPVLVTGPDPGDRFGRLAEREDGIVLDLGAGNDRRHPRFVNVDIASYPEVDLVADAEALPFAGGSVAGIVSITLLEHVARPERVITEAHRALAVGGRLYVVAPFLQPFHPAPDDYRRWTLTGLREEVERDGRFRVTDKGVYCGPASAMAWMLAEWLAVILSFGRPSARRILAVLFQALCSPLKWLDVVLARLPGASNAASALYVEAQKTGPQPG